MSHSHKDRRHGRRGGRGGGRQHQESNKPREEVKYDESSAIIQQFLGYQKSLDRKHDKHERLVKLSRDVTIDSKRIIFLLQRLTGKEDEREKILEDAEDRLHELQRTKWRAICLELQGEDPYQYLRAYSPGLQEYIEAISFHYYLKYEKLIPVETVEQSLTFSKQEEAKTDEGITSQSPTNLESCDTTDQSADSKQSPEETADQTSSQSGTLPESGDPTSSQSESLPESGDPTSSQSESLPESGYPTSSQSKSLPESGDQMSVHIPPLEYMLGIADLTGELMRVAITSVGSGDLDKPFKLSNFLRGVYDQMLLVGNLGRELNRKIYTLKQSLQKVETACYALQVRGSEVPKHMLADMMKYVGSHHEGPAEDLMETV